ncbi:MAG: polyprenol phosphomannose-dependent alpha 1,6 mannosyltransferase MptB [Sporichthyaceae bacterium]|nr:polyprenol phosphomannose-dependent alpha 1,6 mannosyltransferase MptB [Sporichthyaceae bacterium]
MIAGAGSAQRAIGWCLTGSLALVVVTGLLGPSAAQPPLPQRRALLPPYWFPADPSAWLVTGLLLVAVALAIAGLLLGLRALAAGWRPEPGRLQVLGLVGVAAMALIPPMGSADVLVYGAYGRIASLGGDPYTQTARDLAATGDPIGAAVEAPWQDTESIYGPVGTAEQWLAAELGGGSTHATVFALAALGGLAFLLTGWLLDRLARRGSDPALARARVALLWSLNPLLLFTVVNGAHIDAVGIVFAVAGLTLLARSPLLAGIATGLAIDVKLSFGLFALALAWSLRRAPRRQVALAVGGVLAVGLGYAWPGLDALSQAGTASRFVSFASPWRLLVGPLEAVLDDGLARTIIAVLAWAAFAAVAALLARALPGDQADHPGDDPTPTAIRTAAVLGLAWLLTATYSLPWYDVVAWAPFALLAASRWDALLVARTGLLTAAYLPGRVVPLPAGLGTVTRHLRGAVAPVGGVLLLALTYRWSRPAGRTLPTPTAPQPPGTPRAPEPRSR